MQELKVGLAFGNLGDEKRRRIMKKLLSILACFAFVIVGGIALVACGEEEPAKMSEADFLTAIQTKDEVVLTGDVNLTKTVVIDKEVTINLNGKSITEGMTWKQNDPGKTLAMFQIVDGGELTVKGDGKVTSDDLYIFPVKGSEENHSAKLVIEDGSYKTFCSVVQVSYGAAEVKGGAYEITNSDYTKYTLNLIDNRVNATITVTGGTFKNYDPAAGKSEPTTSGIKSFVPEGYESKETSEGSNVWVVSAKEAA